jgi:hypothetical protein
MRRRCRCFTAERRARRRALARSPRVRSMRDGTGQRRDVAGLIGHPRSPVRQTRWTFSATSAVVCRTSRPPGEKGAVVCRTSRPSREKGVVVCRTSRPSSAPSAVVCRTGRPSGEKGAVVSRTSRPSSATSAVVRRTSRPFSATSAVVGRTSRPSREKGAVVLFGRWRGGGAWTSRTPRSWADVRAGLARTLVMNY